MPTQPIEANIQSTGKPQEDDVFFHREDAELPSEEQLCQRKQQKCKALHTEPPVITWSYCYKNDNCTNTLMQKMDQFNKVARRLFEQNAQPLLPNFRRQMLGLPLDEQVLATNPRYIHYSQKSASHSQTTSYTDNTTTMWWP